MKKFNIFLEFKFDMDFPLDYTPQQRINAAKKQILKAIKEDIITIGINEQD